MASYKTVQEQTTISDAISSGYSILQSLRDEVQEIVDNASDGLRETQRIQTFDETANTLGNFCDDEPDVPDNLSAHAVTAYLQQHVSKRRSPSRAVQCQNAVGYLRAAADGVQEFIDTFDGEDRSETEQAEVDDAQELLDILEESISEAECCEFPGMYG